MKKRTARIAVFLTVLGFAVGSVTGCVSSATPSDGFQPVDVSATPTPLENTSSITVLDSGWSPGEEGQVDEIWSQTFLRTFPDGRTVTCFTYFQRGYNTYDSQIWCLPPETPVAR